MRDPIVEWAKELQSLAQAGLHYGRDVYDRERYQRIREIAAEMAAARTGLPLEKVRDLFCGDKGYQTPKIDTRAVVFREDWILLVCEREKWSLPGGWCDFNLSPSEALPPLDLEKCNEEQVRMCFAAHGDPHWTVQFD